LVSIAASTVTYEIQKFFGEKGMKRTALCYDDDGREYDWDKINLIIVSKYGFNRNSKPSITRLESLKKFKYRFVVIVEAHLSTTIISKLLREKIINYASIILLSGTFGDIKNLTAKSCTSLAEYFNLNKHIVPLLLKHPQFRNYIEIKELDLPKIHVEVIRVECTEEQKFVTAPYF